MSTSPTPRQAGELPASFAYVETDVPPGMTLAAWRRARAAESSTPPSQAAPTPRPARQIRPNQTPGGARDDQVFYKHIKRWAPGIRPGARVKRGQLLGYSWSANGVPHLHIAVRHGNPKALFGIAPPAGSARA